MYLDPVDHPNSEQSLVPIHNHKPSEIYHPRLMYNPEPVPQPDQLYPTLELSLELIHHFAPEYDIASIVDPEPKYP